MNSEILSDECVICLDKLNEDDSKTLICGHVFHAVCIDKWEESNISHNEWVCPLCRYSYIHENTQNEDETNALIHSLELVKFRRDRTFIMFVTSVDILLSFVFFHDFGILFMICSGFGFIGATALRLDYLNCYAVFCVLIVFFKFVNIMNAIDDIFEIQRADNADYLNLYFVIMLISAIFQIYVMQCVYRMIYMIALYRERLIDQLML